MTAPIPKVQRVVPRCYQCGGTAELVRGDGPIICRSCVRIGVRLAVVGHTPDHDDQAREGWR